MNQEQLVKGAQEFMRSDKVTTYLKKQRMRELESKQANRIEVVNEAIARCSPDIQGKLRPMLQVETVMSLLHSIVAECREKGEDPAAQLSAQELLEQIARIEKLQKGEDSAKAMERLETTFSDAICKAALQDLPVGGCFVEPKSIDMYLEIADETRVEGNKFFSKHEFEKAFSCYEVGERTLRAIVPMQQWKHKLSLKITKPRIILLSNMALAALRMKKFVACVSACDQGLGLGGALLIDGMENKLLFRRAKARSMRSRSRKLSTSRSADLRARAMDDCRQILSSKHAADTPELKVKIRKLIEKYNLGLSLAEVEVPPCAAKAAHGNACEGKDDTVTEGSTDRVADVNEINVCKSGDKNTV